MPAHSEPNINPSELARLCEEWGDPHRHHAKLVVRRTFFERWKSKFATRRGEVMFLLPRPGGLLVHRKRHYPPGVWRLLTGGIEAGESVLDALRREVQEEVGYSPPPRRFVALITYEFTAGASSVTFTTYAFLMAPDDHPLRTDANSEVAAAREVPLSELPHVARVLRTLPGDWGDWGRFRAVAHDVVARLLRPDELL